MTEPRRSRAPGKLVLLGEYAVIDGAPALVAAVDRFVTATLTEGSTADPCQLDAPELLAHPRTFTLGANGVTWTDETDERTALVSTALAIALEDGLLNANQTIKLTLTNPQFFHDGHKLGIGSSAAATVALAKLLLPANQSIPAVHELAERIHCRFQGGQGSGIDIAASTWSDTIRFQRRRNEAPAVERIDWPASLHWLALWTGSSASTRGFLTKVKRLQQTDPKRYDACFGQLRALAQAGIQQLTERTVEAFCRTVDRYHDAMAALGDAANVDIVSAPHRALSALSRQCGAAYKPSGAGGGDIGVAFGSVESIRALTKAASQHGFEALPMGFAPKNEVNTT